MTHYLGLRHLLGSYLHQDFADDFPTAMDAVQAFASGESPESVQAAANDIPMLLADEKFLCSGYSRPGLISNMPRRCHFLILGQQADLNEVIILERKVRG